MDRLIINRDPLRSAGERESEKIAFADHLMLNCDLGENESAEQTRELLALVDAASIGCGVHAGSLEKTCATISDAQKSGVRIGAHPGLGSLGGRGLTLPTAADFRQLLYDQVGAFCEMAEPLGAKVDYIKLHGGLYHAVETDATLAETYVAFLKEAGQGMAVFSLAGGSFAGRCHDAEIKVYEEAFADRAYQSDGSLMPRSQTGAVLVTDAAFARYRHWLDTGEMPTNEGSGLPLKADTLCVHGDSPGAIELLRKIRRATRGVSARGTP